jgi:ABC-type antimicrobial peptide transport system permease subunit
VTWRDAITLARRSVGRRGGRAVLTVLAVALGAALLSSLLIASQAARQRVLDQVASGGPLAGIKVDAAAPDPGALDSDNPRPGPPRLIDDRALHTIQSLPDVASVVPVIATPMVIVLPRSFPPAAHATRTDAQPEFDAVLGVDLAQQRNLPITVLAGRLPAPGSTTEVDVTVDYLQRAGIPKANASGVVGTSLLLGAPRVFVYREGRRDRALWARAEVVGVVSQEAGDGLVLMPITRAETAREWSQAGAPIDGDEQSTSQYSALFVVARGLDRVTDVRAEINRVGYSTSAPESLITQVQRYLHVVEIVLAGIGLIGLAIAAIGISNAMLAAVRERRHEIGVLKAVGASDRDVRRVFLVEAGTLGFAGGVLGAAVGFGVAQILAGVVNNYLSGQGLETVDLGFPVALLAAVVAGATVLALGAGVLPASRAARMPARQAIADE